MLFTAYKVIQKSNRFVAKYVICLRSSRKDRYLHVSSEVIFMTMDQLTKKDKFNAYMHRRSCLDLVFSSF